MSAGACDVSVMGHERRLMQVMSNLISNASKFSEPGAQVDVWAERIGTRVRVCVRDRGVGIPPNSKDKVFGHFTQIDSSDQRKTGGSGLGMSISKQIVERHGGYIDYFSEMGEGTTFFFEIDICNAGQADAADAIQPPRDGVALPHPAE